MKVASVTLSNEVDVWGWGPDNGGTFTVNSTYRFLDSLTDVGMQFSNMEEGIFRLLWKSKNPSKAYVQSGCSGYWGDVSSNSLFALGCLVGCELRCSPSRKRSGRQLKNLPPMQSKENDMWPNVIGYMVGRAIAPVNENSSTIL
ncbi:hypothetical protein A2U01_0013490 [Trifolium medium]|uniref:Uncharacterized protein n=1 Tax=Trifolium medium TaxID=97028 RepID=A0A392MYF4_9FABA|nr:hypothetical protein [Trifolium medium]